MKEKSADYSSEGDRTFDIKYKFDISDRKGKTGETFKHESGFDFQDFKDFREENRTQKSQIHSQKKWLPSDLIKKSEESLIITENQTEISIRKKGGSFIAEHIKFDNLEVNDENNFASYGTSPKFSDSKAIFQTVNHGNFSKPEMTNSQKPRVNSKFSMPVRESKIDEVEQKSPSKYVSPKFNDKALSYNVSSSRNKAAMTTRRLSPEEEYKDILTSIQYYQNENDKIEYETSKLLEEIAKYEYLVANNASHDYELQKLTDQTYSINTEITNQRNLEKTLIQKKSELEEQFDQIAMSIESLRFQRPTVIKDETKALIDEINSLKAQFEALKRDEGSLNFSTTLLNPTPTSLQHRFQNIVPAQQCKAFNPEQALMNQYITEILSHCKFPNFIYNIKMMAIRDEWKIYEDTQVCINYTARDYPIVQIKIGNKSVRNLGEFGLREGAAHIADKEVLQAKNYYIHGIRMAKVSQPFLKLEMEYRSNVAVAQPTPVGLKRITFFLPTLPLKHGQFIPVTAKEYDKQCQQHRNVLEESSSIEKPIDGQIIKQELRQLLLYFPNLLYERSETGEQSCRGIFRLWNSSEGALVKIRMKDHRVSIYVRNNINFLLQSLEFILTLILI